MLRAETNFKISTFRFNFVKFDFHATSESTFRFWLATGKNGQRTNSYAHKVDLYYEGAIGFLVSKALIQRRFNLVDSY